MKLIEVKNLTFSYAGKKNVLNNVSLDVESGTYTSIIGRNGSGKSTIAKLLMGLLESKEGEIVAFGDTYNKKTIRGIRQRIGIVFQNPDNQFIGATVRDDIAFGLENRRVPQTEMEDIINKFATKVNMVEFLDKEPDKLSGGQKQRIAIAGILAMSPDVIILDEATSMLDPKGKREIKETIDILRKENPDLAILSITHDVEEAFNSDKIIVLNEQSIAFDGSPKELLGHKDKLVEMKLDIPFKVRLTDALIDAGLDKVIGDLND